MNVGRHHAEGLEARELSDRINAGLRAFLERHMPAATASPAEPGTLPSDCSEGASGAAHQAGATAASPAGAGVRRRSARLAASGTAAGAQKQPGGLHVPITAQEVEEWQEKWGRGAAKLSAFL